MESHPFTSMAAVGHGVGMSQNGAQGMAKEGKDYESILKFFYSGTEPGKSADRIW